MSLLIVKTFVNIVVKMDDLITIGEHTNILTLLNLGVFNLRLFNIDMWVLIGLKFLVFWFNTFFCEFIKQLLLG